MNRIAYLDVAKCSAIIAVVCLHVAAPVFYSFTSSPSLNWWVATVVDSFTRWGVPVFLFCSGVLMLHSDKDESLGVFFKKRFIKVCIPFIVWSVIYVLYRSKLDISNISVKTEVKSFIKGASYYHLYFIYYLLGLYLVTPILRIFVRNATPSVIKYFIIMWLISTTGYSYLNKLTGLTIGIPLFPFMGFVGYYVLGYYLANIVSRIEEKWIIIFGVLGLALTVIGTRLICGKSNGPNEYYFDYLNISVVSASAMVFLIIKKIVKGQYSSSRITGVSNLAFGIYLVHPMILGVLDRVGVSATKLGAFVGIPVTVILTLFISGVIVYILRLTKVTRYIVP